MHVLFRALYRLEIVGRVPPGPCVVVANHESLLDPPLVALAAAQPLRFLAKEELWRTRVGAWLADAYGAIPVARGRGDRAVLGRAVELLEGGESIGIFPQGTVRGGPWSRGAARIALAAGAPLVPVRIVGSGRALSRGRVGLPRIRVVVGEPVPVARAAPTVVAARELTAAVAARVDALA
ncbi:MAG TPA: lysophospholipid acyltransferase family protein [Gaiellaceae bacterium]|nr:lysophospholipid acyltransferase family protein [Gaiellaceae bacterium]